MDTNQVNEVIRKNATTEDCPYRQLQRICHTVFDAANARFFNSVLPTPVLDFETTNLKIEGRYVRGHHSIGTHNAIVLNAKHFNRSYGDVLAILLHMIVHLWEDVLSTQTAAPETAEGEPHDAPQKDRHYHGKRCVCKCGEIGIPTQAGFPCVIGAYSDDFAEFLCELGIDPLAPADEEATEPQATTKRGGKTWRCGCPDADGIATSGENFKATCGHCGQEFVRSSYRKSA